MLKITEAGRRKVATPEFAEEVRKFVSAWRRSGKPEEEGKRLVIARIALELASHNGMTPDGQEFKLFIDESVAEINAAAATMLANVMSKDASNGPIN